MPSSGIRTHDPSIRGDEDTLDYAATVIGHLTSTSPEVKKYVSVLYQFVHSVHMHVPSCRF
jgi:hypothetical protein